jgi:hypothetical protein
MQYVEKLSTMDFSLSVRKVNFAIEQALKSQRRV